MRTKFQKVIFIIGLYSLHSNAAYADIGIAFSSGQGIHSIIPYRLSLSWEHGPIWGDEALWGLNLIWENSFAFWDGPSRPDLAPGRATHLNAATTGPMFRWQRRQALGNSHILPYTELGIGLSWLSETEIEGRVLSLHFQFEDKFGIGARMGNSQQYDFAIRAYHYSNASIKRPNSGVNLAMVSFGFWFTG